jgi:hypothetical protein
MNEIRTETHPESKPVLNRLLALEQYSLANYLLYAPPWVPPGREHAWEQVRRIAEGQRANALQLGRLLVRRYGYAASGLFPVEFTRYNDLSLEYLVPRLIEYQGGLIDEIARCAWPLAQDEEARQLVERVLEVEKKHLDMLLGLVSAPVGKAARSAERQAA